MKMISVNRGSIEMPPARGLSTSLDHLADSGAQPVAVIGRPRPDMDHFRQRLAQRRKAQPIPLQIAAEQPDGLRRLTVAKHRNFPPRLLRQVAGRQHQRAISSDTQLMSGAEGKDQDVAGFQIGLFAFRFQPATARDDDMKRHGARSPCRETCKRRRGIGLPIARRHEAELQ
ncbi:hypothetical protein GGE46_000360 [Rhizobium etli]|uniref:Uncharacterized protein n=1 Tax=Rhizobium etli TaxID=29449 RepID=A0A7W6Y5A9_RHIET|nr:hypothetical protein [Rhizobium etli]MBB4533651.1 hypothetical protein [Rhizobium etli]